MVVVGIGRKKPNTEASLVKRAGGERGAGGGEKSQQDQQRASEAPPKKRGAGGFRCPALSLVGTASLLKEQRGTSFKT